MNNKGFTLIELLVVVLILGILAAMAMPQYFKAVERSRMSEAVSLLASIAQSEQRKYMQINKYTKSFKSLDVAPKDASGQAYCTKGLQTDVASLQAPVATTTAVNSCKNGNGFVVVLDGDALNTGAATATRSGSGTLQYAYSLKRFYGGQGTFCTAGNANGAELCADFCGVDMTGTPAAGYTCCSDGNLTATGECATPGAAAGTTTTTP